MLCPFENHENQKTAVDMRPQPFAYQDYVNLIRSAGAPRQGAPDDRSHHRAGEYAVKAKIDHDADCTLIFLQVKSGETAGVFQILN